MRRFKFATLALSVSLAVLTQAGNAAQQALKVVKTETGSNYFVAPHHSSFDKDIGSNLTMEAWINPSAIDEPCAGSYMILNQESSYEMALRNGTNADTGDVTPGVLMTAIWPADNPDIAAWDWNNKEAEAGPESVIPINKWSHVAFTYDGLIIRMFVNGKYLKSWDQWVGPGGARAVLNVAANQSFDPEPFRVGRRHSGTACHQSFDGLIDELRISKSIRYTEAGFPLPTKEFAPDADTVALYHFNEASTGSSDVAALKAKLDAQGIREDDGQGTKDEAIHVPLDVKATSKDAGPVGNHGGLVGEAVLVAATTPITE